MKLRWKILICVGIFSVLMVVSLTVTMHIQPQNGLEAYKKLLRDKGEKLGISEVLPPHIPDESNGVSLLESAFSLFVPTEVEFSNLPPAMRMVAPGKAMVGWAQSNLVEAGSDGYTNSWRNAQEAVEANQPAIELLRQAGYRGFDFNLDYTKGTEMLLKHLPLLRRSERELSAAAMCDLHNGDTASATTNICALLALVQNEHDERVLISQLVRIIMASVAASASWELLQSTNLTDQELASLQKSWEQEEFIEGVENSLLMERASDKNEIETMRASTQKTISTLFGPSGSGSGGGSSDWFEQLQDFWNDTKESGAEFMWRTSWSYSDELQMLQNDQIILETMRTVRTNQSFSPAYTNMLNHFDAMGITNVPDDWVIKLDIPDYRGVFSEASSALSGPVRKAMAAEACKRIAATAIVLKRFQLKHGNFPGGLSELTPEFLASVPLDPVDGQPLRYRRYEDGTYLLYSIGDDGVDDGGDTTPVKLPTTSTSNWNWQRARDWVWPQPATSEEVQYYYEHPPK
jgi:hypothetical protein